MGPIQLLIVQCTPFCNLDCTYCYLPDRANPSRIDPATVATIARRIKDEGLVGPELRVCWHAGEPLVYPREDYKSFVEIFHKELSCITSLEFSLQTNGTLINADWCDFFIDNGIQVGISLDGPEDLHDRYRVTRGGKGTYNQVLKGLRLMQNHGIDTHVIAVLHSESIEQPHRLFEFFEGLGVKSVCFNVEEHEGVNGGTSLDPDRAFRQSVDFFMTYFSLIKQNVGSHWLREYSDTLRRICSREPVRNSEAEPLAILTVDHNGEYSTFSPELAGIKTARYPLGFGLGSMLDESRTISASVKASSAVAEVLAGVDQCRQRCTYFDVCGGGSSSNKLAENEVLASAETLHCRLTVQAQTEAMLGLIAAAARSSAPVR